MNIRQLIAAAAVATVATLGAVGVAGAAGSTFTVSDTNITLGETVTVRLTTPCTHPNGDPEFGNVIMSSVSTPSISDNQETKGAHFDKGATGVFSFPQVGTYTITRFCDTPGMLDQVTITVTAPSTTTTAPTTAAPTTAAPTTTRATTTTTTAPAATTTTAKVAVTTTTVATSVAGITSTKTTSSASSTTATAAKRVASSVSYTG